MYYLHALDKYPWQHELSSVIAFPAAIVPPSWERRVAFGAPEKTTALLFAEVIESQEPQQDVL